MRKLLCALLFAFVSFWATAQNAKNVLEIDPASFRPVQTGTLSGVAIDKIAKDRSQRECARIKLHVNRMTREEIEQLQVHIIGGMVALTKRELAYEGNGLIIEMTAKPQTRFYLHHDKYGDSNEVTVDLEGNKEYFLDAHLNYYYSITVRSNTADVEVYLDGVLRGRTNSNNLLTVEKVFPGEHRLQMKYGGSDKEKIINVNSQEVFFEQYVDIAGRIPQDVVFEIRPVTAVLKFEGEILPLDEGGAALKTVAQGTYKYSIEADEYHPYSGTVTVEDQMVRLPIINLRPAFGYLAVEGSSVRDAKLYVDSKLVGTLPLSSSLKLASGAHEVQIVKAKYKGYSTTVNISDDKTETITPTLEANFANVTLTASEGVEIVINNQSRGTGRWSGELAMGQYRVECRKAGHKPSQQSLNISSAAPVALRLNDPEPIYGSVRVVSNPLLGMVKIDGRTVGETPRNVERLLVGKHTVEVSKSGYRTWSREITIAEGPMQTITAALEKIATATPTTTTSTSTSTSWSSSNTSGKTYKVGDYYNKNGKKGVVFWVDETGKHGKIVSLTESSSELQWSSDEYERKRLIGADDKYNGANNMAKVKQISGWKSKYPAFKWCADLGEGWYLPAIEELKIFTLNTSVHDAVNQTLASKGKKLANKGDSHWYWSSTEYNYQSSSGEFYAWLVRMRSGYTLDYSKSYYYYVRAVSAVTFGSNIESTTTTSAQSAQRFAIAVSSNVTDAEVYIDNKFCGRTDNNYTITITDILEGEHTLRIQYNGNQRVQKITVNRNNIYFRCDVNTTAARPQYVVFALEPKNAIVTIDGATYMPDSEGYVQLLLLNGTHNYSVKAQGYHEESGTFTVNGAKVGREIMLRPVETNATTTTTTTSTSTSWSSSSTLGRTYKVGDYYNKNGKKGVVFWVDGTGQHGKIVSLTESSSELEWSSDEYEQKRLIGANDENNGANNMAKVKQISGWESKYPAFKWCADLGEGWYLPAIEELKLFTLNTSVHDVVNQTLASKGKKLANKGDSRWYWSSTEYNYQSSIGWFCAWLVRMLDGDTNGSYKSLSIYARAVSAF